MMLFSEMYFLTKDTYYTDQIVKIVRKYYANGGSRFYPNGLSFTKMMAALKDSNNPDTDEMLKLFSKHAENIIEIGTCYPPHEVNYEQTIVTPAVTLISHMGILTDDGLGSCAYVYPYSLSGKKGQFYDEWANDQDYALYFVINEELDEKEKLI